MAAIVEVLTQRGALAYRTAAGATRAALGQRSPAAHRGDDLADVVRRYGSLEAYQEEQRRCGVHQVEARLRVR